MKTGFPFTGDIVRINNSGSQFHKEKAIVRFVALDRSFYDIETLKTKTYMRVVPQQIIFIS